MLKIRKVFFVLAATVAAALVVFYVGGRGRFVIDIFDGQSINFLKYHQMPVKNKTDILDGQDMNFLNYRQMPVKNKTDILDGQQDMNFFNYHQMPVKNKTFLYLTQTEKCLKKQLSLVTALGDPTNRDVLVLSFRKKCNDTSLPHVTYISNFSCTWAAGRRLLYYTAKKMTAKYLYYIFTDDDILLEWVDPKRNTSLSTWRSFENFLLDVEPPLAATDNTDWKLMNRIFAMRKSKNCTTNGVDPDYFVALWFDATVNAFHHNAIEHVFEPILPLWTRFDKISWWFPQWYENMIADIVYHGQALFYSRVIANNAEHRKYPQKFHDGTIMQQIAEDVRSVVPFKYNKAAEPLLKKWVSAFGGSVMNIPNTVNFTYCLPAGPSTTKSLQ